MKRIVAMMLVVLMVGTVMVGLTGCGGDDTEEERVVTKTATTETKSKPTTTKPKVAPVTKPKIATNNYSDAIMTCELPARWEGDHLGYNEGWLALESELSTPAGSYDFEVAIGVYCVVDYMSLYGSTDSAIKAYYDHQQGYDSAFSSDGCSLKYTSFGSKKYRQLYIGSPGEMLQTYYTTLGNDLYYIEIWVESSGHTNEINTILSSVRFKDK